MVKCWPSAVFALCCSGLVWCCISKAGPALCSKQLGADGRSPCTLRTNILVSVVLILSLRTSFETFHLAPRQAVYWAIRTCMSQNLRPWYRTANGVLISINSMNLYWMASKPEDFLVNVKVFEHFCSRNWSLSMRNTYVWIYLGVFIWIERFPFVTVSTLSVLVRFWPHRPGNA